MPRPILDESQIHPAIREQGAAHHKDIIDEVKSAVAQGGYVVVGMAQNPHPKRAKKALEAAGIPFRYLEYGSYTSEWRRRTALKMWTGWPTFPMVFHDGVLIGGASELQRYLQGAR